MSNLEQQKQSREFFNYFMMVQNYKKLALFIASSIAAIAVIVSGIFLFATKKEKDFYAFKASFNALITGKDDKKELKKVKALLSRYPQLQALYQYKLAQHFLSLGEIGEAKDFISFTDKKNPLNHTYFQRFSENSLLIEQKQYEKAFEESLLLKEDLLMDSSFWKLSDHTSNGSYLFSLNLIRIGCLAKTLAKKEIEHQVWEEILKYLANQNHPFIDGDAFNKALESFSQGQASFKEFIAYREKQLTLAN